MDSPTPGSQLKSSITDATRKIESIIDDAERAAAEIRAEARADGELEAQKAMDESSGRLAAVVNPLIERVENLRVETAALSHELESAAAKLRDLTAGAGAPVVKQPRSVTPSAPSPPVPHEPPPPRTGSPGPAPVAYPGTGDSTASKKSVAADPPEEAVLRATQMAVAGSPRAEIEDALREEFGLEDVAPVVNDILGDG